MEDQQYLEQILKLSEDNHKLLQRINRRERQAQTAKMIHRVIVIVGLIAAYIYIEPYLKNLESMYQSALVQIEQLQATTSAINPFLKKTQ